MLKIYVKNKIQNYNPLISQSNNIYRKMRFSKKKMKHYLLLLFRSNSSNRFLNEVRKKRRIRWIWTKLNIRGKWVLTYNCSQTKVQFNHLGILKMKIHKSRQRYRVISKKIHHSLDLIYSIIKVSLESRRLPTKHVHVQSQQ